MNTVGAIDRVRLDSSEDKRGTEGRVRDSGGGVRRVGRRRGERGDGLT